MKTCINKSFVLTVAAIGYLLVGQVTAQTFTTLHSFTPMDNNYANSDGANPHAGLLLSGNTLYGTAYNGGSFGNGTVFAMNMDGTGFSTLYSFTAIAAWPGSYNFFTVYTNSDGANPVGGLISSGTTLYGTAFNGGSFGEGTVFKVNMDGTGFTTLYSFTLLSNRGTGLLNSDGADPDGGLILSGSTLYGVTFVGGTSGPGTLFKVNTDGTGFSVLHNFTGSFSGGHFPYDALLLSGDTLYGAMYNDGAVYAINADGTGFTNLYEFTAASGSGGGYGTNSDGYLPSDALISSGNTLYGTTGYGGTSGNGTVFAVGTDGTGFKTLHSFTNTDGVGPLSGLLLSGSTLYGTAQNGGRFGNGTVFAINTDGTGFTVLHDFTDVGHDSFSVYTNSDGANPYSGLILSSNTLYGTAVNGGTSGVGTVFSISLPVTPPQLTIAPSAANVILTWPTTATGYTLQSTTNLASPIWTTNLPAPVVVNGQYAVTNPISGSQQFFRLSQ
jgi:uncharacterized repeat protein (TIGR03803 family)